MTKEIFRIEVFLDRLSSLESDDIDELFASLGGGLPRIETAPRHAAPGDAPARGGSKSETSSRLRRR